MLSFFVASQGKRGESVVISPPSEMRGFGREGRRMGTTEYRPGLEGVIAGETEISEVDPDVPALFYRGYAITDLAENATFEEVAYLLLYGDLPNCSQLDAFKEALGQARRLPGPLLDLLRLSPKEADPMDILRTAVSFLGMLDPEAKEKSLDANRRKAIRLTSQIATIITTAYRLKNNRPPVEPRPDLSHAAHILYTLFGEVPDEFTVRVLDVSLILYAEHTFNASAFTARVIASTHADLHAAITGALGALKGPLHGGANERAMQMLLEIGETERAEAWVMERLARKERIMGFGHRIYKRGDSRVPIMKRLGKALAERTGQTKWVAIAEIVERVMEREKQIPPNVDFPCGYTYYLLGLPIELYTPLFAAARVVGWAAHIIEQYETGRLIRPTSRYVGPKGRQWVPLKER